MAFQWKFFCRVVETAIYLSNFSLGRKMNFFEKPFSSFICIEQKLEFFPAGFSNLHSNILRDWAKNFDNSDKNFSAIIKCAFYLSSGNYCGEFLPNVERKFFGSQIKFYLAGFHNCKLRLQKNLFVNDSSPDFLFSFLDFFEKSFFFELFGHWDKRFPVSGKEFSAGCQNSTCSEEQFNEKHFINKTSNNSGLWTK